jgi:hypothetical protein
MQKLILNSFKKSENLHINLSRQKIHGSNLTSAGIILHDRMTSTALYAKPLMIC